MKGSRQYLTSGIIMQNSDNSQSVNEIVPVSIYFYKSDADDHQSSENLIPRTSRRSFATKVSVLAAGVVFSCGIATAQDKLNLHSPWEDHQVMTPSTYTGDKELANHSGCGIDTARDFNGPVENVVCAPHDGVANIFPNRGGYGNCLEITDVQGNKTIMARFGHLRSFAVSDGQVVKAGKIIGVFGSTGNATGIHLHYEEFVNGVRLDLNTQVLFDDQSIACSPGKDGTPVMALHSYSVENRVHRGIHDPTVYYRIGGAKWYVQSSEYGAFSTAGFLIFARKDTLDALPVAKPAVGTLFKQRLDDASYTFWQSPYGRVRLTTAAAVNRHGGLAAVAWVPQGSFNHNDYGLPEN